MDVAELSTPALEAELVGLAGHLAAAQCRFLLLLAEFDARQAWARARGCARVPIGCPGESEWICARPGSSFE